MVSKDTQVNLMEDFIKVLLLNFNKMEEAEAWSLAKTLVNVTVEELNGRQPNT